MLDKIFTGMKQCCHKMTSSANLIDYFVHDILDYTILTSNNKKFTKDVSIFDIRESVEQILVMFEDKIKMKKIKLNVKYDCFRQRFLIKTDQKRL